jgi:hypothetical protein
MKTVIFCKSRVKTLRGKDLGNAFNHKEHRDHKEKLFFGRGLCGKLIRCVVLFGKGVLAAVEP